MTHAEVCKRSRDRLRELDPLEYERQLGAARVRKRRRNAEKFEREWIPRSVAFFRRLVREMSPGLALRVLYPDAYTKGNAKALAKSREITTRRKEWRAAQLDEHVWEYHRHLFTVSNRVRSLKDYHNRRDQINGARRVPPEILVVRAVELVAKWLDKLLKKKARLEARRSPEEAKLARRLRRRYEKALGRMKAGKESFSERSRELLGCSLSQLKAYLEAMFQPGMTWENHGQGPGFWQIDHIVPVASFRFEDPGSAEKCFHFSNLQPLWWEDNMAKRDRLDFLPKYPIDVSA